MPRTSAAASLTVLPRLRLEPPPHLSKAEREVFFATVNSVKPEHFAPEDLPLLSSYCAAVLQERAVVASLAKAPEDEIDRLRAAYSRATGDLIKLARALRLGPMARDSSRRRLGSTRPPGARPREYTGEEK